MHVYGSSAALLVAAAALSGCAAVWGRAYTVESQSPEAITIKYDRNFGSLEEVRKAAQAGCEEFGRSAVMQKKATSIWRLTTVSFKCVDRQSGLVRDRGSRK